MRSWEGRLRVRNRGGACAILTLLKTHAPYVRQVTSHVSSVRPVTLSASAIPLDSCACCTLTPQYSCVSKGAHLNNARTHTPTGAPRHVKGLRRQVEELLAVAADPQHQRRWRAPSVVLFFPSGVAGDVRRAVEAMGAHVAEGPGETRDRPMGL